MSSKDEKNLTQVTARLREVGKHARARHARQRRRLHPAIIAKAAFRPAGGVGGELMPAAWYLETANAATERRIAEIVRAVVD